MGNFRFYRRLRIFPGLSVNLSKSGPSLTVGVRGAHVTVGRSGIRRTIGIPGTGIYYTSHRGAHTGYHSSHTETPVDPATRQRAEHTATTLILLVGLGIVLALGIAIGVIIGGGR
jgi:Protein of unknown function (DUF4236)